MRETMEAKEAAELLGVSTWTVYDLARKHVIPCIKIGRRVLFRRASLLAWLDAQEQQSRLQAEDSPLVAIRRLS
ncbi:MAG: helix-turn-helix domain-containing protein [Clostridia bacterium]|nr:helix-turn-helix domain-containing protein [Clostridia bacterium]